MTGNNDDERDPDSLYIGSRLACVAFMVFGFFFFWDGGFPPSSLYKALGISIPFSFNFWLAVFWFGGLIYMFIYPWKMGGRNGAGDEDNGV
jgi:hypothetical protein